MLASTPKARLGSTTTIIKSCQVYRRTFAAKKSDTESPATPEQSDKAVEEKAQEASKQKTTHKTVAQMDEELRQKMAGQAGDGGEAGIEYEDGQPVSMKRSVKNNMFRYI